MIYYVLIAFAVILFAVQFVVMKFYSQNVRQALAASFFFAILVGIVSAVLAAALSPLAGGFKFTGFSVLLGAATALALFLASVLGIAAVRLGSLGVFTTFMMLGGMLLPFIYGAATLGEPISGFKIAGVCALTVSLFLPLLDSVKNFKKTTVDDNVPSGAEYTHKKGIGKVVAFYAICLLSFCANGVVGVVAKIHALSTESAPPLNFVMIYSLFMAALGGLGLMFVLLFLRPDARDNTLIAVRSCMSFKPLIFIIAYAAVTSLANLLQLIAAGHIAASLQYPLVTGGVVVLCALTGRLIFKEKMGVFSRCGIALTLISTILFAF